MWANVKYLAYCICISQNKGKVHISNCKKAGLERQKQMLAVFLGGSTLDDGNFINKNFKLLGFSPWLIPVKIQMVASFLSLVLNVTLWTINI